MQNTESKSQKTDLNYFVCCVYCDIHNQYKNGINKVYVTRQIICNNTQYSNIQTFLPHVHIQSVIVMSYNHFTHIECPLKVFVHGIVNQHHLLDLDQGDLKVINSLDQKSCKQINQNLKQFLF